VDVIISPAIEPSGFELETKHEFAQVVRNEIGLQVDKSRVERLNRAARLR
jgi:hypothetical protein